MNSTLTKPPVVGRCDKCCGEFLRASIKRGLCKMCRAEAAGTLGKMFEPEQAAFAAARGSALFAIEYRWARGQGRSVAAGGSPEEAAREFKRAHPHVEVIRCW